MKAKVFLQQVRKLDTLIRNKMIEKQQLQDMATGTAVTLGERVQSSGSQQRMADTVGRYIDLEVEIDNKITQLFKQKNAVIEVIEQLDPAEYDFLHKVYIQYMDLYDVAERYGKTYSWATTTHGRALKKVQAILDSKSIVT